MAQRYTLTLEPAAASQALALLAHMGARVESSQPFLGTAIVEADPALLPQLRAVPGVQAAVETSSIRAA